MSLHLSSSKISRTGAIAAEKTPAGKCVDIVKSVYPLSVPDTEGHAFLKPCPNVGSLVWVLH